MCEPDDIVSLCEAHYRFLSLWPESVREDRFGAAFIGNRLLPIPFRNHVALVRSRPEQAAWLIERANAFYQQLAAPLAFQLDPATTPLDFPAMLARAGYEKQVEEAWMVCPVREVPVTLDQTGVTVIQLTPTSPASLIQAYIDCYNISFRAPAHVHAGFDASFCGVLPHEAGLHFVGLVDGEPAGAVSLFHHSGQGGVYNVGTFPAFRGQGVATTLLLHLLGVARRLGLVQLILQAVHHGPAQPIYERVGFRTHFVRDWYLPEEPGGIWS
jgi:GNAT superfamily N-acetyltransferase